jgi:23S rRNA C2498 (ribose-2'-O)-methylase RlmM
LSRRASDIEFDRGQGHYDEARRCEAIIRDALVRARVKHALALRQLYHDREEITGFVGPVA